MNTLQLFIYSPDDGHWGFDKILVILQMRMLLIFMTGLCVDMFFISLEKCLEMKVLMHMVNIYVKVKMKVKVTQSCPTLCDPVDYTVHGIL